MSNNLKERILEKIKAGVPPHSRWYFIWRAAVVTAAAVAIFTLLLYLTSWLVFILHANGAWWLLGFGPRGWRNFLFLFPFLPALAIVILIAGLAFLAERWRFVYRQPLFYLGIGLVGIVLIGSWLLVRTSLHRGIYRQSAAGAAPLVGPLYRHYGGFRPDDGLAGIVRADIDGDVSNGTFDIETAGGERFLIQTNEQTRSPFACCLMPGDQVMVMGDRDDSATTVAAFGVRKVRDEDDFFGRPFWMRAPPPPRPRPPK